MDIPIVFKDASLIVIDKPSGIVVNRSDTSNMETIQDWAETKYQIRQPADQKERSDKDTSDGVRSDTCEVEELESNFYNRAGIVHRLDKETSGLLIIAKNPQVFEDLQLQFKERKVTKKYITLVHGKVSPKEGEIRASVGRLPWNRERFGVLPGGREATTSYKVVSYYNSPNSPSYLKRGLGGVNAYSLLEVTPHTGRTHQIRIHLKYLGHPVVSDRFYAGRKTAKKDVKFCPRLFLHATYLKFVNPGSKESLELKSDLPDDLKSVLDRISKNA